ncbi:MAG TPA: hypothetical protein VKW08_09885 [Xanthobacteraceae bacterium]|jgi:hypothetical protein|nr:hypothetical protein [Xanthobacteraceae bacterium]
MTLAELKHSTANPEPPALAAALVALWWEAKGDWGRAHTLIMDEKGADCAWVHAYLHRREGDLANARYWYGEAGRPLPSESLAAEWNSIAAALLDNPMGLK